MAKRHPNDRNEKAVQAARVEALDLGSYTLKDGTKLILHDPDPIFLSSVMNSVSEPKKPSYEVTLASGRKEQYPMDEKVAEQSPELKPIWDQYLLDSAAYATKSMELMLRAVLLDAVELEGGINDPAWERRMRIVGVQLPQDSDELRVFYLMGKIDLEDRVGLIGKVMRRTGVPEEIIGAAEDSFRSEVRDRSRRPDDVADPGADARGDGAGEAEPLAA